MVKFRLSNASVNEADVHNWPLLISPHFVSLAGMW